MDTQIFSSISPKMLTIRIFTLNIFHIEATSQQKLQFFDNFTTTVKTVVIANFVFKKLEKFWSLTTKKAKLKRFFPFISDVCTKETNFIDFGQPKRF